MEPTKRNDLLKKYRKNDLRRRKRSKTRRLPKQTKKSKTKRVFDSITRLGRAALIQLIS